ncbi:carbohydrate ABC transporter permease [Ruminiclostridium cellobioparum]|jgi:multiple sugar transport system permease protein|uniref:carbohydrate ABC transporter permease n=1 Tax=Ruminiclostridium cellobioparum TaxID=29355 RepID=UPI000686D2F9|nr:carbohydrate ABC transporter permease [Ruminiclostridium cellobioparum]
MAVKKIQHTVLHVFVFIVFAFIALIVLVPILWMLISSFKPQGEIISYPPTFISEEFTLNNFIRLAKRVKILYFVKNSIIYALMSTVPSVFLCSLAGYAFARYRFKGRNVLFILVLATLMIPFQVIMIPLFLIVSNLGMYDSYLGLVLPKIAVAISIFMMRSAFTGLPKELEEAGRIDGVSELGLFFKIMLPQVKPTFVTLVVLGINGAWNDLTWPLLITGDMQMRTLSNGLAMFVGEDTQEYGPAFAGAFISILPMLLLYLFGQRYFVEGTVTSGVKG